MACPVCDHTMQNIGVQSGRMFWCPRCGTLKAESSDGAHSKAEMPIWVRTIVREAHVGGVPSISYHSVMPCRFVVESNPTHRLKVSLLEVCT